MRVKLIATTPNPIDVMWTAARTCYSAKSPVEMWEQDIKLENTEKHLKLVKAVLDSGHMSIAEHVNFTFAIEGISRACSHQLVRHRLCTFSQQSQRYVEIKEDANKLNELLVNYKKYNDFNNEQELREIVDKYFVITSSTDETFHGTETNDGLVFLADALLSYLIFTARGVKAEDARSVLPNATKTNIVVTTNLRNLIHISELRLCTRAQKEIRQLFKLIKEEVTNNNKVLGNMLMAQCDRLGYCPEASKCCGKRPTLQDNLLSKADWEQLMNACEDPQVNEKIIKLMKMKPAF